MLAQQRTSGHTVVHNAEVVDAHSCSGCLDVQQLLLCLQSHALHLAYMLLYVRYLRLQACPTNVSILQLMFLYIVLQTLDSSSQRSTNPTSTHAMQKSCKMLMIMAEAKARRTGT